MTLTSIARSCSHLEELHTHDSTSSIGVGLKKVARSCHHPERVTLTNCTHVSKAHVEIVEKKCFHARSVELYNSNVIEFPAEYKPIGIYYRNCIRVGI
jgi:hypothetical protein